VDAGRPGTRPGASRADAGPAERALGSRETVADRAGRAPERASDRFQDRGNRAERAVERASDRWQNRWDRAEEVRDNWREYARQRYDDLFDRDWYGRYRDLARDYYDDEYYRYAYAAWAGASWATAAGWLGDDGGSGDWSEPYDYDYGSGGTVYYQGNTVYAGSQPVATATQYAEQAMTIADSGAQTLAATRTPLEWLPLGVYAMTREDGGEPTRFLQLAVSKDGLISGTYYNAVTNQAFAVEGSVDRATQRAAWYATGNRNTVMEAGIYNLTEDQAPALVHFGTERVEEVLLVRLPDKPAQ
jgi:hypothetical protein